MDDPLKELSLAAPGASLAIGTSHAIASIALSLAMKYHEINTVQDGALYQQYKLEGKNFRDLNLDVVFETAIAIELHLMGASERIAALVMDALVEVVEEKEEEKEEGNDG